MPRFGGPQHTQAPRGANTRTLRRSEQPRAEGTEPRLSIWRRPVSHLTRKTTEAGPRLPEGRSGTMSKKSAFTAPRRAGGSGRDSARFGKNWQAGSTNSCQATATAVHTTCASGVVAARASHATTCSSTPEIQRLWKRVEKDCEWESPRAPTVQLLFRDERATPALLGFLRRIPGQGGCRAWLSLEWRRRRRSCAR